MSANVVVYVPWYSGFGLCWLGCISHYIVSASWRLLLISEGECNGVMSNEVGFAHSLGFPLGTCIAAGQSRDNRCARGSD